MAPALPQATDIRLLLRGEEHTGFRRDLDLDVVAGLEALALLRGGDHLHPHGAARDRDVVELPRALEDVPGHLAAEPPRRALGFLETQRLRPAAAETAIPDHPPVPARAHRDARAAGGVAHHAHIA